MRLKPFALILCQPTTEHHVANNNTYVPPPKKKIELKIRLQGKKSPILFFILIFRGRWNKHKKFVQTYLDLFQEKIFSQKLIFTRKRFNIQAKAFS
jgi:hypothetical protein